MISSISRGTLSTNETHEKESFDDWYVIICIVKFFENLCIRFVQFKDFGLRNIPTRHFYSPCETETTLLHLSPTSTKVRSSMQSTVTLVMDQSLVVICAFITILELINHGVILDIHINFLLVMFMAVNKQRTFLLVSTSS